MIRTTHLCLEAGPRCLVDALDWEAKAGECWAVLGRNGAGKSTLLRTLAGLRLPEQGEVHLGGRLLADWPLEALARERAFLAQSRSDAFAYRVIEAVLTARHPYHADRYWDGSDDHRIAMAALAALDVADLAQRDVRSLSGGERQRVALAALLAQQAPLMLLDEPATALDLPHQIAAMRLLAALCRDEGRCVVLVGHDLNLAFSTCSHALLLMGQGRWLAGPVDEVMRPETLSACLGHPIDVLHHGGRTVFVAAESE
ncbi:ABC transporter ATP-binding protein [Massilia sp. TS11]|uniref:ABC transporter ATP-binding protein n=1 Tax=Massilia sp. TS11 TaxID=2908003 RepID=UPI001EDC7286|nr:ABC transporter ATP-binding protein [Massilia sp. TS11]MCG2585562.1 ABC transporter ATP-binding protein [Massilia sp. TS11]